MIDVKQTPEIELLNELIKLLSPIRTKASYIEYGTGSKSKKEPPTQFSMVYKGFQVKVMVKRI